MLIHSTYKIETIGYTRYIF